MAKLKLELVQYEKELKTMKPEDPVRADVAFEIVWHYYPMKIGKKAAKGHFKASVKTKADYLRIQAAHNKYIEYVENMRSRSFRPRYQYGSTFFNNWQDWAKMAEED